MRIWDKIYIGTSDWMIRVITENKRLLVLMFVLNLTYFVSLYMMIEFRGLVLSDAKVFFICAEYMLLEIFVVIMLIRFLPKHFAYFIAVLTAIFFCVDSITLMMYRSLFDKGMFQIILDTNIQEAAEYIIDYSGLFAKKLFYAIPLVLILALLIKAGVALIEWFLSYPIRILRCFVIIILLGGITLSAYVNSDFLLKKNPLSIFRISFLIPRAFNEIREYREVYNNLDSAQIEITRNDSQLPWVIFILGESTNRYHMSIYGYDKLTTPNLQRRLEQNNLIIFTDCVSGANETMPVCQRLFTFYDNRGGVIDKPWYQYSNLFDILKAAGYHTAWLSNQEVTGIYGNVPRAFADRCNEKSFTTIHDTETTVYEYDEKILPLLDTVLSKNSSEKNFYVLHLLGTHLNYRARYPAEFEIFKAADEPATEPLHRDYQAAYDNAVLYNDFVIDEIIKRFEDKDAIIIYMSDHGEDVLEDGLHLGHYPFGGARQFEIPMIVWLSEAFKANHPDLERRIRAAKDLPFMTDDMIHALLDLMAIETEDFDSRRSLFSKDFDATRKRIYQGREYVNGEMIPVGAD